MTDVLVDVRLVVTISGTVEVDADLALIAALDDRLSHDLQQVTVILDDACQAFGVIRLGVGVRIAGLPAEGAPPPSSANSLERGFVAAGPKAQNS